HLSAPFQVFPGLSMSSASPRRSRPAEGFGRNRFFFANPFALPIRLSLEDRRQSGSQPPPAPDPAIFDRGADDAGHERKGSQNLGYGRGDRWRRSGSRSTRWSSPPR